METNQHLFKELEAAEKLFSDGSIKNAQKILRNVLKESKTLDKIPNKLRHKINAAINKSRYFDEISSFAANPKRNELIKKLDDLIKNPNKNLRKHAHNIHEIQTQWQVLDLSSKPASKSQWLNFNDLTKKAWEPCKEYFDEIKQIKIKNALSRNEIINNINEFVNNNSNKWPNSKSLIIFLQKTFKEWQKYAPVLEEDLDKLKKLYFDARKPINEEIRRQENENKEKKTLLIKKVADRRFLLSKAKKQLADEEARNQRLEDLFEANEILKWLIFEFKIFLRLILEFNSIPEDFISLRF